MKKKPPVKFDEDEIQKNMKKSKEERELLEKILTYLKREEEIIKNKSKK